MREPCVFTHSHVCTHRPITQAWAECAGQTPPTTPSQPPRRAGHFHSCPQQASLPDFVQDVDPRLLQQHILHEGAWDGDLLGAGVDQVLPDVGSLHHAGAKVLSSIDHGLEQGLQGTRERVTALFRGALPLWGRTCDTVP